MTVLNSIPDSLVQAFRTQKEIGRALTAAIFPASEIMERFAQSATALSALSSTKRMHEAVTKAIGDMRILTTNPLVLGLECMRNDATRPASRAIANYNSRSHSEPAMSPAT